MSAYFNPLYKTVPCRHFDNHGRPIKFGCGLGDRCRFIHPNDPQWRSAGLDDKFSRRTASLNHAVHITSEAGHSSRPRSPNMSPGARNHAPTPGSKVDLPRRCKVEASPDDSANLHHVEGPRKSSRPFIPANSRSKNTEPYPKPYDTRSYLGVQRPDSRPEFHRSIKERKQTRSSAPTGEYDDFQPNRADPKPMRTIADNVNPTKVHSLVTSDKMPATFASPGVKPVSGGDITGEHTFSAKNTTIPEQPPKNIPVGKLVDLFRRLAQCSNQIARDTAAHDKEGTKLQTYNQISSTLASITPTAANAVTPILGNIIRSHMQSQLQVEANLKALEELWEQVFDVLLTEITRIIDVRLEDALKRVNTEIERVLNGITESVPSSRKRTGSFNSVDDWRGGSKPGGLSGKDEHPGSFDREERDRKRRRLGSNPLRDASAQQSGGSTDMDPSIKDILQQITMKIDRQTQSLDVLNKENSQLKAALQIQPSSTPFVVPHSSGTSPSLRMHP